MGTGKRSLLNWQSIVLQAPLDYFCQFCSLLFFSSNEAQYTFEESDVLTYTLCYDIAAPVLIFRPHTKGEENHNLCCVLFYKFRQIFNLLLHLVNPSPMAQLVVRLPGRYEVVGWNPR